MAWSQLWGKGRKKIPIIHEKELANYPNPLIPDLVALTGPKGVGKSTIGEKIIGHWGSLHSFADPLRDMLEAMGVKRYYLKEAKEEPIEPYGKSARQMLQTLGTEWGRESVNSEIWVMRAEEIIKEMSIPFSLKPIVFDDLRFQNEADMIHRNNGQVWLVRRKSFDPIKDGHKSEIGIPYEKIDKILALEDGG